MKRRFLALFLFAALVPFSACSDQEFAQTLAHHHLRALSDVGFIRAVSKQASLVMFQKELPSNPITTLRAIDPGAPYTAYRITWAGNSGGSSCQAEPSPQALCGVTTSKATIVILDEFSDSNHNCTLSDPYQMICAPQESGVAFFACVGEYDGDRAVVVTLPAVDAVCDEFPGEAIQNLSLATWCGDQWVYNDDMCGYGEDGLTLDNGEKVCSKARKCIDSACTAPFLFGFSAFQHLPQCIYNSTDTVTDPPTATPTDPQTAPPTDQQTAPLTGPPSDMPTDPITAPPTEPQTTPPTDLQTALPTDPQTALPTDPQTALPTDPRTAPPTDPQTTPPTAPPTDPQTTPPTAPPTDLPTDPPTDDPTSPPVTSPPSPASSCDTIEGQLIDCVFLELDLNVAMVCDNCTQNAFASFSDGTPCEEIEPMACSALSCSCGSCNGELEATFNCLGDERGCQFECGNTDRTDSSGASARSYPSVLLGLISLICM